MNGSEVAALVGIFVSAAFGYLGVRAGAAAQNRKARTDEAIVAAADKVEADKTAGQVALDIARDVRKELGTLKRELGDVRDQLADEQDWQVTVREWWGLHEDWDDAILVLVEQLSPGASAKMPPRPRLPLHPPRRRATPARDDRTPDSG